MSASSHNHISVFAVGREEDCNDHAVAAEHVDRVEMHFVVGGDQLDVVVGNATDHADAPDQSVSS